MKEIECKFREFIGGPNDGLWLEVGVPDIMIPVENPKKGKGLQYHYYKINKKGQMHYKGVEEL